MVLSKTLFRVVPIFFFIANFSVTFPCTTVSLPNPLRQFTPSDTSTHKPVIPPQHVDVITGPVYIKDLKLLYCKPGDPDSLTVHYIRIEGNLPSPCHNLFQPQIRRTNDTLFVKLATWIERDKMCSQVLQPFIYHYKLDMKRDPVVIKINDQKLVQ